MLQGYQTLLIIVGGLLAGGMTILSVILLCKYPGKKTVLYLIKVGSLMLAIWLIFYGFLYMQSNFMADEVKEVKSAVLSNQYDFVGNTAILKIDTSKGEREIFRHPDGSVYIKDVDSFRKLK